jgi:TolB protein
MTIRPLLLLLLPAALMWSGGWAGAETSIGRAEKPRVMVRPLTGSTGVTVTRVLVADLEHAGTLEVTNTPSGAFVASGHASGGRVEGRLADASGQEIMRVAYESVNLKHSAHQFADDIVFAITHVPGISTSVIAFVSDVTKQKRIYLCDCDGSDVRMVTTEHAPAVSPSIARDAGFLTYTGYQSGYPDVHFVDLLTGRRRRVVSVPGTNGGAAVSPDGRRMALTMTPSSRVELLVASTDGRVHHRCLASEAGWPISPAWSPDGDMLAVALDRGTGPRLALLAPGSRAPRLLATGFRHCVEPDWSPDGERLVFVAREGASNHIALFDLEAGGRARLLARGESPCWGADGRHIVYSTGSALVVHDVDSGERRTIVSNMGRLSEPSWTK